MTQQVRAPQAVVRGCPFAEFHEPGRFDVTRIWPSPLALLGRELPKRVSEPSVESGLRESDRFEAARRDHRLGGTERTDR